MASQFIEFPKKVFTLQSHAFVVDPQYTVEAFVGQGAQGIICAAQRTKGHTSQQVAIKKIPNVLDEIVSCKRLLRELRLLRHLQHENLPQLIDIMLPPSSNVLRWKDAYIVTDLMDTDLLYILKSGQEFTDDHVQYLTFQLLSGLSYLHSANVVHRDLKPSNLLVNRNCDLKICDFGLARSCASTPEDDQQMLTMYVTTRWYRAPELLCLNTMYGSPVDIWSAGCIIAEMILRRPLLPGRDFKDQLRLIIELVGMPSEDELKKIENLGAINFLNTMGPHAVRRIDHQLPACNPQVLFLLNRMLSFDPAKRVTAQEGLQYPYLASYVEEAQQPAVPPEPGEWAASIGSGAVPKEYLQNLIFQEMLHFHPETISLPWGAARQESEPASPAVPRYDGW